MRTRAGWSRSPRAKANRRWAGRRAWPKTEPCCWRPRADWSAASAVSCRCAPDDRPSRGAIVAPRRFTVILLTARDRVRRAGFTQLGAGMALIAVGGFQHETKSLAPLASPFKGAAA